jgi:hypothetical protein
MMIRNGIDIHLSQIQRPGIRQCIYHHHPAAGANPNVAHLALDARGECATFQRDALRIPIVHILFSADGRLQNAPAREKRNYSPPTIVIQKTPGTGGFNVPPFSKSIVTDEDFQDLVYKILFILNSVLLPSREHPH